MKYSKKYGMWKEDRSKWFYRADKKKSFKYSEFSEYIDIGLRGRICTFTFEAKKGRKSLIAEIWG